MGLRVGNTSDVLEVCSRSMLAIVVMQVDPRRLGAGGGSSLSQRSPRIAQTYRTCWRIRYELRNKRRGTRNKSGRLVEAFDL
jgi:hypothetical protein